MYMYTTVQMLALHYQEACSNSVYKLQLKTTCFALTTAMKALGQVALFPGPPSPPQGEAWYTLFANACNISHVQQQV